MKDENKIIKKQCYVMYFSLLVVYLYMFEVQQCIIN